MSGCTREASQYCDDSPTEQYPGNPDTRAELVQEQVAWYFENKVAKEEDSRKESILLAGKRQLLVHSQSREPNVDPINKRNHKKNKDERDDMRPQSADRSRLNYSRGNSCASHHDCPSGYGCRQQRN
jgi:hypothetical protein